MVRKDSVAWILNIIAKKIWMQSIFNLRIHTAEHSYGVQGCLGMDQHCAFGRNSYLPCQYLPTSALNTRGWTPSYSSGLLPWETGSAADAATVVLSPAKQTAPTRPFRAANGVFFIFWLAELAAPGHCFVHMPRQLKSETTPIRAH